MKTTVLVLALAAALAARASTEYAAITNAWYSQGASNLLVLAEARLATNQNDIAGLLMKASYDFDCSDRTVLSNSLQRILDVGPTVDLPVFKKVFAVITRMDIASTFRTLARETPEKHAADRAKMSRRKHPMAYALELHALEKDGFFK